MLRILDDYKRPMLMLLEVYPFQNSLYKVPYIILLLIKLHVNLLYQKLLMQNFLLLKQIGLHLPNELL